MVCVAGNGGAATEQAAGAKSQTGSFLIFLVDSPAQRVRPLETKKTSGGNANGIESLASEEALDCYRQK